MESQGLSLGISNLRRVLLILMVVFFFFSGAPAVTAVVLPSPSLTFWGPYLDSAPAVGWPEYLKVVRQMKADGFTHIGVRVWNPQTDVASQLADLRAIDLPLAFISSPGHRFLANPAELDPANHVSNNQNLKYFDTPGFDPYQCRVPTDCPTGPHVTAHDPAYAGVVWQKELDLVSASLDRVGLRSGDVAIFDTEIWAEPETAVEWYYPRVILDSPGRYQGAPAERYAAYRSNWLARARDLVAIVRRQAAAAPVLFYAENQSTFPTFGWMPAGSGDAPAPEFYWLPDLGLVDSKLVAASWSATYPWVSFSFSAATWKTEVWDPTKTQKLGWLLRTAGAGGAIVYPGPFDHNVPINAFLAHAKALTDGFLRGFDPDAPRPILAPDTTTTPPLVINPVATPAVSRIAPNVTPSAVTDVPVLIETLTPDTTQIAALQARVIELMKILVNLLKQKLNRLLILRGLR